MSPEPYRNLDVSDQENAPSEEEEDLLPGEVSFDDNELDDGFSPARLSYVLNFLFLPFCLLPYLKRDNGFSLFHAKQALAIWIGLMTTGILGALLLPFKLGLLIWLIGFPVLLTLNYLGLVQVSAERAAPLPLIKKHPQGWFPADVSGEDEE